MKSLFFYLNNWILPISKFFTLTKLSLLPERMIKTIDMKGYVTYMLLLITTQSFSQIISPNGSNLFYYNGAADVTFRYADRGTGGRALVHDNGNVLTPVQPNQ